MKMDSRKNILRGEKLTVKLPPDLSMGQFILDRLPTFGDRVALINGETDERITFAEILNSSRRLAVHLAKEGVQKDDRIAVCSENSLNFYIPILSAMFLGAASCPLNPGYSEREFVHSLRISRPKYIFVVSSLTRKLREIVKKLSWSTRLISMDESVFPDVPRMSDLIESSLSPNPDAFEACKINGDEQIITILCSSGTTGLPKGVMLTNKNFLTITCHLVESVMRSNVSADFVSLNILPFFHAYAFISMINQIAFGVTVVLLSRFDPEQFLSTIQRYKVQRLFLVPPLMVFLAKSPILDRYDVSSINQIWCGAAPLSTNIQDAVYRRLNKPAIHQGYGLTETTLSVLKTTADSNKPGSVGKLTPDTLGKVMPIDGDGEPLGPYKEGELCFKGDLIMKGYCGDESSTMATIDDEGWLHTGDIGYYDDEGYFYIVDRLKELIKYKGFQVPPAELEGILLTHPGVLDAAVVGIPDERSGELPVGFVVKQPRSNVTASEIVEFVNARVSSQKWLRGGVRIVQSIPKTPSGKILRRLLRNSLISKL